MDFNRRDFLKGASLAAFAVGTCVAAICCCAGTFPAAEGSPVKSTLEEAGRADRPMRTEANSHVVQKKEMSADFVVVGGGLSGICAAIAAARHACHGVHAAVQWIQEV